MLRTACITGLASFVPLGTAVSAEYLTSVVSEVYQAEGTARQIATRASICISQHLKPGLVNAPLILSSDLDQGVIVARSAVEYPDGLLSWKIRSTFSFEAREGRFRIEQTSLERLHEGQGAYNPGWNPIGKWPGSGWKRAEAAFGASANRVAQCVISNATSQADW